MQSGFWGKLKKPIMALAPMANVTDAAFRRIIARYGAPDVFWTEFVSVEGLLSRGKEALLLDFIFSKEEHPIVAQIFGGKPEQFFEVGKLCRELGFDGVDINMGCPDKGVEKSGGGAALIKNPKLAQEIIRATMEGSGLPVSVKTRIGYNKDEIDTWIPAILETKPAALTVHLRTRKEMSFVPARWEEMSRIKVLRDKISPETVLLGNGDVLTVADARDKVKKYGIDGVMIGRGIFGNPWLFAEKIPTIEERLRVCLEHTKLFEELFGPKAKSLKLTARSLRLKPFDIMKKHYKAYINGFDGAKELRVKLMEAKDVSEVEKILKAF
jgi:nifR3 family TIM-barrel protein